KKDYDLPPRRDPRPEPSAQSTARSTPKHQPKEKTRQGYTLEEFLKKVEMEEALKQNASKPKKKRANNYNYTSRTYSYGDSPNIDKIIDDSLKQAEKALDGGMKQLDNAMKRLDDIFKRF